MTTREALRVATQTLSRRDAETLLMAVLDRDRAWLLAYPEQTLAENDLAAFQDLTARRAAREPLQYLVGQQEFYGLALRVTPATLIPRPETEHLVEAVLYWCAGHAPATLRLLDVGTGTGAIALACASRLDDAAIVACDLSHEALQVARGNAERLGMTSRVQFFQSDLLAAVPVAAPFDVIVANPPYIPDSDAASLQPEVAAHEPHLALFAGEHGLDIYRRLIPQAHAALRGGGLLAMEIGYGQRDALTHLLTEGWERVRFLDDYAGIPRVVLAERTSDSAPLP